MNKKTLVTVVIVAVLVLALLLFGLPLFSQLVYGRSQAATLLAWQLDKEAYTSDGEFVSYIAEKFNENAVPYHIPPEAEFTVSVEECTLAGIPYFLLNRQEAPENLLIYFPGGSFIDQPRVVHWQFLDRLAADTGAMIAVPIYPKLPANDAQSAYASMIDFYKAFTEEYACGRLLFMGDSAGGGMALSLAMQLRDAGLAGPAELVLICPWVDVTMTNSEIPAFEKKDPALDSTMLAHLGTLWAGDLDPKDPVVSPLYGSFEDLGHITLLTGTGELLYPDIMLLDSALTESGIGHDTIAASGMFHVWPLYLAYSVPEVQTSYAQIAAVVAG